MTRDQRRQGFALISAIFLLVVIAAVGAAVVRVSGVQRTTTSFALLGPKAFHAARSGVEWAVHQALTAPASCPVGITTTNTFSLTEGGLTGFDLSVDCAAEVHTEAGVAETAFQITSFAEWGAFGDRDYVSRRLEMRITSAP